MKCYLQLTFIPQIEKEQNFFLWLTDENGHPLPFPGTGEAEEAGPEWLKAGSPYHLVPAQASFISTDRTYPVSGALSTMESVYRMIRHLCPAERVSDIAPGQTMQWFGHIAEAVSLIIDQGQFYPYMYHLEDADRTRSYFCTWLPVPGPLLQSGLFSDWLSRLPHLSFEIADLQDERVQQWLYLIVIYWMNALIRHHTAASEMKGPDHLTGRLERSFPFNFSEKPWITTADPDQIEKLNLLELEVAEWVEPAAGKESRKWIAALINFKKKQNKENFLPDRLTVSLEPDHPEDPFSANTLWAYDVHVFGTQDGERLEKPLEAFRNTIALAGKKWLDKQLKQLSDAVPEKVMQLFEGSGRGYLSSPDISELYQQKGTLETYAVRLLFPADLKISDSPDTVSVDLSIHSAPGQDGSLFSLASLISYDWRISIGDLQLSAETFRQLVKANQSFIRHGNKWIHLPRLKMEKAFQEISDAMELFENRPDVAAALRLEAVTRRKRNRLTHIRMTADLENYLKNILKKPSRTVPVPSGFTGELRPYQKKGYTWLVNLRRRHVGGCLADDMGLGKTVQAIAYLDYCRQLPSKEAPDTPSLIICPTSLVANWKHEFNTFSPGLDIYIHHGSARLHGDRLMQRIRQADVVVTSYTIYTKEASWFEQIVWRSAILDEAQAIKNPHAQKTRALRTIRCAHRLALTGTPIENRLEELWSIMDFLNPGYLGTLERFRRQFIRPVEKKNSRTRAADLTRIIQPFILRREKTDKRIIRDLPDKFETKKTCYLSKDQASLYQSIVNRLEQKVRSAGGIQRKGLILSALTRLKQVCDDPALIMSGEGGKKASGKLALFYDLLDPLFSRGKKVLVFTQYVGMGEKLLHETKKRYPDADISFLHGSLSARKREQFIRKFQEDTQGPACFILSLKAGGVGINLTAASYVIHYDRWWNPAVEEQATDRAYRIGQKHNVQVYKLICSGTLEERIDQLIEQKKTLQQQILNKGEGWVTELSDSEIFDLIRLREGVM
ncbi:DEAD/DEAH box helicase [Sporolactobacillus sp. THM19-2]|uniref:DEAD/DEAH box helicase n=1 Tax=Sporolactobacillus sp. THM19-2 TaxID=2511171 RepID=UPI001021CA8E|nr:DEAD/DEAH box helicase [Sporolactobacillus sp. THM19-2]RYL93562.1 DEAD/DEAH box helicase [Sporolactobacillus sp. THM19-2]